MFEFALLGLGVGATYALAAQGIVLIYRGSGVVNFAHGGFAVVGAYAYYELLDAGWPAAPALVLGLACAGGAGAGTHLLIMRNIRHASPLVRMVATLGLLSALQAAAVLKFGAETRFVRALLPDGTVAVFGAVVTADRLWLLAVGVLLSLALWAIYRFTTFGLTTSAVAENRRSAAALGRSPDLVATVNWTLGGVLAGAAGIALAPIVGLSVSQLSLMLIPALAAALVGGFSSFWLTCAAGLAIGIAESELTRYVASPGWPASVPFLVIVATLALRGQALPVRGFVSERLPVVGAAPRSRAWPLPAAGVALLIGVAGADWVAAITTSCVLAMICLSLVVVTGYTGQLSLAQFALAGCGAFVAARLSATTGAPFPLALLAGVLCAVPIGLLVGLPSLRTRGVSLGIATLGLGLAFQNIVLGNPAYTGGNEGTTVEPPSLFGLSLDPVDHPERYAWFALGCLVLAGIVVANLRRSPVGRRLIAVRANERAAASLGLTVGRAKLYAFGVGSALAGLAGVLLAFQTEHVLFTGFNVMQSIDVVIVTVIGGVGFVGGALLGGLAGPDGVFSYLLSKSTDSEQWLSLITGTVLVLAMLAQPDGIVADAARLRARLPGRRRRPAARAAPAPVDAAPPATAVKQRTLTLEDVSVRFGVVVALDSVSFTVRSGEIVGLIGPNGAGKTTLIDAVTGVSRLATGRVLLNGEDVAGRPPAARARAGIVRTFQSVELFEDLDVRDNLRVAADHPAALEYLTDLVRPRARPITRLARDAARELEIVGDLDRMPAALSYGRRRLVGITRALAAGPTFLLLDEPAAGLAATERAELARVLRRLAREWGIGVLLIEHDVALVLDVCDRVVALDFGNVIAAGPPSAIRTHPAVVAAYLGAEEVVAGGVQVGG